MAITATGNVQGAPKASLGPDRQPNDTTTKARRRAVSVLWLGVILFGACLRVAIVALPGNHLQAAWSGGGDADRYVLLGQNLVQGKGLTYASEPTALRAPGYPLLLAGFMRLSSAKYLLLVRWFQFALGLGTVYFCWRASTLAFGRRTGRASLLIALVFPTLVFITGEILTECVGAFLAAVFLYLLIQALQEPRARVLGEMGLVIGVAALFRFNMAALIFVGVWAAFAGRTLRSGWQRAALLCVFAGLAVSPWLVRNQMVFHGQVLYSTLSGHDAVEGVLVPQGRAFPGDTERIEAAQGWTLEDIETNRPSRLRFPSEADLNRHAWHVAAGLWSEWGWRLLPLALAKCSYFWLSTDQVFWTEAFSLRQRALRWGGVLSYWVFLGLGIAGWLVTYRSAPALGRGFLLYAVLLTALHLPFPMITRLRVPLMDPLLSILGGAGVMHIWER